MAKRRRPSQGVFIVRRILLLVVVLVVIAGIIVLAVRLVGKSSEGESSMSEESQSLPEESSQEPEDESSEPENSGEDESEPETSEDIPVSAPIQPVSSDDSWQLILASASNPLPSGYAPPQLETISENYQVDSRIAPDLRKMIADAKAEGITLMVCSAYRPEAYQADLHNRQISYYKSIGQSDEEAVATASSIVLPPGTSEHQTGLSCDIVTPAYQVLDDGFAETAAAKWMAEYSWKYGFVLRYPKDKYDTTKIIFEPWHFRYVGLEHAKAMKEGGYCLEEYLYIVQKDNVAAFAGPVSPENNADGDGEDADNTSEKE